MHGEDVLQIFDLINNTHNMSQPPCVSNYNNFGRAHCPTRLDENERWARLEYSQRHAQPPQLCETKAFDKLYQSSQELFV